MCTFSESVLSPGRRVKTASATRGATDPISIAQDWAWETASARYGCGSARVFLSETEQEWAWAESKWPPKNERWKARANEAGLARESEADRQGTFEKAQEPASGAGLASE
jgi:hypothetical protein